MKKILSLIVGITMLNCALASKNKDIDSKEEGNALKIHFNGDMSVGEDWERQGIPHTRKINGKYISSWIQYPDPLKDSIMDNVDVVMQSEDGTFSNAKPLNEFSRIGLSNAYHVVAPYKSFAETNHETGWKIYSWKKYSSDELSLVEQFKQEQCVLCKSDMKQFIIANAQGLPQQVCDRFKKSKDFEAKVNKNIHRTWRQANQEKIK